VSSLWSFVARLIDHGSSDGYIDDAERITDIPAKYDRASPVSAASH